MTNNYDGAECEVMLTARQGEELRIIKYHNQTAQRTKNCQTNYLVGLLLKQFQSFYPLIMSVIQP